jgi:hypothetical protein
MEGFASPGNPPLTAPGRSEDRTKNKGKGAIAKAVYFGVVLPPLGRPCTITETHQLASRSLRSSCPVCWRITEMAQRSIRRFLNPIVDEVLRDRLVYKEESGRIPLWPGRIDPAKGRIHLCMTNLSIQFSLAFLRRTIHSTNAMVSAMRP